MSCTFEISPSRQIPRRLLKKDLAAFRALQSQTLPAAARLTEAELSDAMALGELWGIFLGDRMTAALALLPMDAPCRPCLAPAKLAEEKLCGLAGPAQTALLWAPAADPSLCSLDAANALRILLESAIRRAEILGLDNGIAAAVPVRGALLSGLFQSGLRLTGLRPLLRLCACYLFTLAPADNILYNKEHLLRISPSDTKLLGRRLEEGWFAVGYAEGELLLARPSQEDTR